MTRGTLSSGGGYAVNGGFIPASQGNTGIRLINTTSLKNAFYEPHLPIPPFEVVK